ncbi:MAG: HAMP domain-containing protein [Actinobacteria bacterium]|nr:HAMP domain-containing protein [Actinomycetota bacterium]
METEHNNRRFSRQKAGSKILFRIIALIVIVFAVSGFTAFFLLMRSQSRLVQKSEEKLIEFKAAQMASTNRYITNMIFQIQNLSFGDSSQDGTINIGKDLDNISPSQQIIDEMLEQLVSSGFFNSKMAFFAESAGTGTTTAPMIVMSSDFNSPGKKVPGALVDLAQMDIAENTKKRERIDSQNSFMFFTDGIPELGLAGKYLVSAYTLSPDSPLGNMWYFTISSMKDELAEVESFYNAERAKIDGALILVGVATVLGIAVVTFLVLSYLIRTNITRPIEELTNTAERVMDGDLNVEVPVRKGEDFESLKVAFNKMVASLKRLVNTTMPAEDKNKAGAPVINEVDVGAEELAPVKSRKLAIFIEVTALVIAAYVFSGAAGLFLFQRSQARLVEKSKEKIVNSAAESIASGHAYVSNLVERYYELLMPDIVTQQNVIAQIDSVVKKEKNYYVEVLNGALSEYPRQGFNGLELAIEASPSLPGIIDKPIIVLSTDDNLMYQDLPGELVDLHDMSVIDNTAYRERIDQDNAYMLVRDGIPELGISGDCLVTTYNHRVEGAGGLTLWFYNFKPMGEQLAVIDNFYETEIRTTFILMGILVSVGVILVSMVTIFVLSYLIRRHITEPIDELAAVAHRVTEGELDIEIPVRKGEEFIGLKMAFNEMLRNLKQTIAKSVIR